MAIRLQPGRITELGRQERRIDNATPALNGTPRQSLFEKHQSDGVPFIAPPTGLPSLPKQRKPVPAKTPAIVRTEQLDPKAKHDDPRLRLLHTIADDVEGKRVPTISFDESDQIVLTPAQWELIQQRHREEVETTILGKEYRDPGLSPRQQIQINGERDQTTDHWCGKACDEAGIEDPHRREAILEAGPALYRRWLEVDAQLQRRAAERYWGRLSAKEREFYQSPEALLEHRSLLPGFEEPPLYLSLAHVLTEIGAHRLAAEVWRTPGRVEEAERQAVEIDERADLTDTEKDQLVDQLYFDAGLRCWLETSAEDIVPKLYRVAIEYTIFASTPLAEALPDDEYFDHEPHPIDDDEEPVFSHESEPLEAELSKSTPSEEPSVKQDEPHTEQDEPVGARITAMHVAIGVELARAELGEDGVLRTDDGQEIGGYADPTILRGGFPSSPFTEVMPLFVAREIYAEQLELPEATSFVVKNGKQLAQAILGVEQVTANQGSKALRALFEGSASFTIGFRWDETGLQDGAGQLYRVEKVSDGYRVHVSQNLLPYSLKQLAKSPGYEAKRDRERTFRRASTPLVLPSRLLLSPHYLPKSSPRSYSAQERARLLLLVEVNARGSSGMRLGPGGHWDGESGGAELKDPKRLQSIAEKTGLGTDKVSELIDHLVELGELQALSTGKYLPADPAAVDWIANRTRKVRR